MSFISQYNWLLLAKIFFLQLKINNANIIKRKKLSNSFLLLIFKIFWTSFQICLSFKLWYIISDFCLECRLLINEYSWFLLSTVAVVYKVDVNPIVAYTKTLLLGKYKVRFLRGHKIFIYWSIHILIWCIFMFSDTLFNIDIIDS